MVLVGKTFKVLLIVGAIVGVVLFAAAVAVALIPLYVSSTSIAQNSGYRIIYNVANLTLVYTNTTRDTAQVQSYIPPSSTPTTAMLTSLNTQLNNVLRRIGARTTINQAAFDSTANTLVLSLQVYFLVQCFSCVPTRTALIRQILYTGQSFTFNLQYRLACSSNAFDLGSIRVLVGGFNNITNIGTTVPSTLSQQSDPCGNSPTGTTNLTGCSNSLYNSTFLSTTVTGDQGYAYYCYYVQTTPAQSLANITFSFDASNPPNGGNPLRFYIDDVAFTSTSNLIGNAGFENGLNSIAPWTYTPMASTTGVNDANPHTGKYGFVVYSTLASLTQIVSLNTVGKVWVYPLSFWMAYSCDGRNCPVNITLTIT